MTDHKCSIDISSIFDTLFQYLPIFLTVLGTPNVPLHMYIQYVEYRLLPEVDLKKCSLYSLCWLLLGLVLFPPTHPPIPTAMMTTINLNKKKNEKKNEQEQIGRVSDLSDRSRWLDVLAKFVHLAPQQQTNKQTNTTGTRSLSIHPSGLSKIGQKGIYY